METHSPSMPRSASRLLQLEYSRRKTRNPMLSIRSFSRSLGIGKTTLSDVLSEKRDLSPRNTLKVAKKLGLSSKESKLLLNRRWNGNSEEHEVSSYLAVEESQFALISNWYYFGLLSLATLRRNRSDPRWISSRLGIPAVEARIALRQLTALGYIELDKGRMRRTVKPIRTSREVPSSALRKFHRQTLQLASESLEKDPINVREFSSMTMPISRSKLKEAKRRIEQFKKELSQYLETGYATEVYSLGIQLFPLTRKEKIR